MSFLGYIPFPPTHGGGGTKFDPSDPSYGEVTYSSEYPAVPARDYSPSAMWNDWKYLLSGDWIGAGLDDFFDNELPQITERLSELDLGATDDLFQKPNSSVPVSNGRLNTSTFDYLNAELAKFYGMDRNTAYQEALANTAYQRAVADMQQAGLNPAAIFGNGRGSSASGVGYVGSSGSGSAAAVDSGKLFSSDDFGLIASLAGLATAVVTKKPSNFWLGQQGAQAVMTVLNGIDKKMK